MDKKKSNRFGSDRRRYVKRKGEQLNPKCLQKTVKRGGSWIAAFSLNGPGLIIKITETINGQN